MLKRVRNLVQFGRLRTTAPTSRSGKPRFLKTNRRAEFTDFLDLVATRYCRPPSEFFFIQIGAFDGVAGDPLQHLVRRHGWRGLLVEPQHRAFQKLKENYASQPQLQFFNVAIGTKDGELTLYTRKSDDVSIASTNKDLLLKRAPAREVQSYSVPCWTIATLLANSGTGATTIDLLQIDTEGSDYDIIQSIDYRHMKPTIVRYEHLLMSRRQKNACIALLASHSYRFIVEENDTLALLAP